jgi:hypothetical protein
LLAAPEAQDTRSAPRAGIILSLAARYRPIFYAYLSGREISELSAGMHGLSASATLERLAPLIEQLRAARCARVVRG